MSRYSGAMFIVGGSGVTFALSAVQDLLRTGADSNIKIIDIVWSISDPGTPHRFIFSPFDHHAHTPPFKQHPSPRWSPSWQGS